MLNLLETRREAGIPDAVPYQEAGAPPQSTEHPLQALRDKQHDDHQQIEAQNRSVAYHTIPYCHGMTLLLIPYHDKDLLSSIIICSCAKELLIF